MVSCDPLKWLAPPIFQFSIYLDEMAFFNTLGSKNGLTGIFDLFSCNIDRVCVSVKLTLSTNNIDSVLEVRLPDVVCCSDWNVIFVAWNITTGYVLLRTVALNLYNKHIYFKIIIHAPRLCTLNIAYYNPAFETRKSGCAHTIRICLSAFQLHLNVSCTLLSSMDWIYAHDVCIYR